MEIGRLEFYATKRDRNGSYFGKIFPYNKEMRENYDGQLVFFHESRVPRESALRRESRFRGYRHVTHWRGRTTYENPVYVAFEAPLNPKTNKEASATVVMLLEEADPDALPDVDAFAESGVKAALISAFPSHYTLSRIGLNLLESEGDGSRLDLLKACWDKNSGDERQSFVESLGPVELSQLLSLLTEIDRRESGNLTSPRRSRQVFTIRPSAALMGDVAARLTPGMWVDGFLGLMSDPDGRSSFLAQTQPTFRAHAIAMCAKAGVPLGKADIDCLVDAVSRCRDSAFGAKCLLAALTVDPNLALRTDVSAMLTPDMWLDSFLSLMASPEDRRALLALAQPDFRAYALTRFIDSGARIDSGFTEDFLSAISGCEGTRLANRCMLSALARAPRLALSPGVAGILTPETWVDGLLSLMANNKDREKLLEHSQPAFRSFALCKYMEAGGTIDEGILEQVLSIARVNDDATRSAQCVKATLKGAPRLALRTDVAGILTPDMWTDDLLDLLKDPTSQKAFLKSAQPGFRTLAVGKIIDGGLPLCDEVFAMCPLRSCPTLLGRVRWSSDDASYAELIGSWLKDASLSDAEGRKNIISAAERMHETGELLSPAMWGRLPAVVRIRLLVFWSNHYGELDDYVVRGGVTRLCVDAYRSSWRGYDPTLEAALLLFALPLARDARKAFVDANDALIGEIVHQFNECAAGELRSFTLGDEMQALLQRCTAWAYVNEERVSNFCDARKWKNRASVWCHAGEDRPEGGRRECKSLRSPVNAVVGAMPSRVDLENQFLADLLANVGEAMGSAVNVGQWLGSGSMDLVEYAYRVSGYVNKMAAVLPHMVCRGCGSRLVLNYKYPRESLYGEDSGRGLNLPALSATMCSCPNMADGSTAHDGDVYIHYCKRCRRVIDSRECKIKDREGYYLCMYCGGSEVYEPGTKCPNCGNTDQRKLSYYTGSMRIEKHYLSERPRSSEVMVACKADGCMYDARDFVSVFES